MVSVCFLNNDSHTVVDFHQHQSILYNLGAWATPNHFDRCGPNDVVGLLRFEERVFASLPLLT